MPTRPKAKKDPEASIGHPDMLDRHPLIVHAAHIHHGHAVFRDSPNITVERVLRVISHEDFPALQKAASLLSPRIREEHVIAALRYAAEVVEAVSELPPEVLTHLQAAQKKGKR